MREPELVVRSAPGNAPGPASAPAVAVIFLASLMVFTLLSLTPCFMVPAEAGMRDDRSEIRYLLQKRFMLHGEVALEYDKITTRTGDAPSESGYGLNASLRLNFKSYVVHPALLTYTVDLDALQGKGDYTRGDPKSVMLTLDFLRTKPLNFSLKAGYIHSSDYTMNQQGISINYALPPKQLVFNTMRDASLYNNFVRNNRKNKEQNSSDNSDSDDNSNNSGNNNNSGSNNSNKNNNNNSGSNNGNNGENGKNLPNNLAPNAKPDLLRIIMPLFIHFDLDRNDYRSDFGSSRRVESYFSTLRFIGQVPTSTAMTNYALNLQYDDTKDKEDSQNDRRKYDTSFNLNTRFKNDAAFRFESKYQRFDYSGNRLSDLYGFAQYDGKFLDRKWEYTLSTVYDRYSAGGGQDNQSYLLSAEARTRKKYGRIQAGYWFGLKYQQGNIDDNYAAFARVEAEMPVNEKTMIGARADLDLGSEVSRYYFEVHSRYLISKRSSLNASYSYTRSSGRTSSGDAMGLANNVPDYSSHAFKVDYMLALKNVSFQSTAQYNIYGGGNALIWDNRLNTTLWNRVGVTVGTQLTREKGEIPMFNDGLNGHVSLNGLTTGTRTYLNAYNTLSYSPLRNMLVRVYSSYSKALDGDKNANYIINPTVSWRIRKLFLTMEYKYTVEHRDSVKYKEERIYFKISRPFWA